MKRSIEKTIAIGFGLAFSVLLAVGLLQYRTAKQLVAAGQLVAHTDVALADIQTILADVEDAESWLRYYAATGDGRFLTTCRSVIDRTPNDLRQLQRLTADNPSQQRRVDSLEPLITRRFDHMERVIELLKDAGLPAARELMLQGEGIRLRNEIRRITDDMEKEERDLLAQRTAAVEAGKRRTDTVILVGSLLAIGLLLVSATIVYHELSQRKRAEAESEKAHRQVVNIMESITDGFFAFDRDFRHTYVNAAAELILGLPKEKLLGKSHWEVFPSSKGTIIEQRFRQAMEQRVPLEYESNFEDQSFMVKTYPASDGGLSVYFRDITESKRAEAALRESQALTNAIVESTSDLIWSVDPEGFGLITFNRGLRDYFLNRRGIRLQAGMGPDDLLPDRDYADRWRGFYQRALSEGSFTIDYEAVGSVVLQLTLNTLKRDGKVFGISVFGKDITESKRAETRLRESEERYRTLFDSIDEGFCTIEVLFDENNKPIDYRFLAINPSFEKQTGIQNAVGRRMREIAPQHEEHWFEIYGRIALTGEPARFENQAAQLHRWYDVYAFRVGEPQQKNVAILFNDITQRKQTEDALRESEAAFRTLAESVPQMVWMCTPDGLNVYFNQRWVDYTGLTLEESYGRGWNTPFHPDDKQSAWEAWNHAVETGDTYRIECRLRRVDSAYRWFLTQGVPLHDATGHIIKWFGTCTDIDDLKQAEVELHRLNRAFRAVTECNEVVVRASEESELLERVCRLLVDVVGFRLVWVGYAEQDETKSVRPVAHAGFDEGYLATLNITWADDERGRGPTGTAIRTGQPCMARNFTADPRVALWRAEAIRRGYASSIALPLIVEGHSLGALTLYSESVGAFDGKEVSLLENLATDLAFGIHTLRIGVERRRTMEALAVQAVQLREQATLLDLAPAAIFVRDLEGRLVYWSHGAEEIYGWSKEETLGNLAHTLLRTQFPKPLPEIEAQVFRGEIWEGELLSTKRDGEQIIVASRWAPHHDRRGNFLGFLEINLNITDRKRAEEEIRRLNENLERLVRERTSELETANKELEAFTYSVSHDLRAPLRHIDGFSRLLQEEYSAKLDETARHFLDRIRTGTLNMGHLIDDLLSLSRIGRREPTSNLTDLGSLVKEVLAEIESETKGRKIEWKVGELPLVECDRSLLKLVFQNLLSNAIKFTRTREEAVIEVGATVVNGQPAIFVRDNGVGFSMKHVDKLFGVFQRLHRQSDFEGTGVGLATVQRIVHKHGGRAWAEGEINQGATFFFTLPATRNQEKPGEAA